MIELEDVFQKASTGTLVYMEARGERGAGSHEFEIWFPYTVDLVRRVRRGSFVAVKNFNSRGNEEKYSLLEIMEVLPTHYALGTSRSQIERSYPGHLVEAAKSAREDWEQEEPRESTTNIRCLCNQTGLAIHYSGSGPRPVSDDALPMPGEEARLLTAEAVEEVVNRDLMGPKIATIAPGFLVLEENVPIHLDVANLLRTHFGLFAFTRGGKSNALSTIAASILDSGADATLVFFDLMGEYVGLLADLICENPQALIVALDEESVPGGEDTLRFIRNGTGLNRAVKSITSTLLLPRELEKRREEFKPLVEEMLRKRKIRIAEEEGVSASQLLGRYKEYMKRGSAGRDLVRQRLEEVLPDSDEEVPENIVDRVTSDLNRVLEHGEVPIDPQDWGGAGTLDETAPSFNGINTEKLSASEITDIRDFRASLGRLSEKAEFGDHGIGWSKLLKDLDKRNPSLVIVVSDRDDELKEQASRLMSAKYNFRRNTGQKEPQISFLLDEADQYIPSNASGATKLVKGTVESIARRGRKFGLGIGIATQRATYLDTSIMAQPHTYMISKLPRKEDRERVGDAFGLSRATLDRTLGFGIGEWLIISFEATGLTGTPVPVKLDNANDRIAEYLDATTIGDKKILES